MKDVNDDTKRIGGKTIGETSIVISLPAYEIGDVVGGLIEFNTQSSAGGGGRITDFYLTDAHNQSEPYTLYLFDQKPTEIDDGDPFESVLTIADMGKLIDIVDLETGHYVPLNSLGWAHIPSLSLDFDARKGNLYLYAVPTATPDQDATDDLKMWLTLLLN